MSTTTQLNPTDTTTTPTQVTQPVDDNVNTTDPYTVGNVDGNTSYQNTGNLNNFPVVPDLIQETLFAQQSVSNLKESDFNLDSKELVTLKSDDCMVILFLSENVESRNLAKLFAITAQQIAGPTFGAVNLIHQKEIARNFTKLRSDNGSIFHWAGLGSIPFILTYNRGVPRGFYNGSRDVQAMIDFFLTLACNSDYSEPIQLAGSMQSESSLQMPPYQPYYSEDGSRPIRRSSQEYTAEKTIRGYNPNLPITRYGSAAGVAAGNIVANETSSFNGNSGVTNNTNGSTTNNTGVNNTGTNEANTNTNTNNTGTNDTTAPAGLPSVSS
jgi:hypothetical protein